MSLVVSGLGMVSSIGRDVVTSCASLRAGLSRPRELPYFEVLEDADGEAMPLIGHPIRGFSDGFYLIGLWVRLGHRCLTDLIRYGGLPDGSDVRFWSRTGLALVTPHVDENRFPDVQALGPEEIGREYGQRLLSMLALPVPPSQVIPVSVGHPGAAQGVELATRWIDGGHVDRVIVLAVDSYLDTPTLEWLAERDRLKTPDSPAALFPGEAGASFLVESADAAGRRGARVEAVVLSAAVAQEPNHFFSDSVSSGVELSNVIAHVLPETTPFAGDLLADLNGEPWRAYELGCARVRLAGRVSPTVRLLLPATSLGETGAASGAVSVCAAVRSFARGYSKTGHAVVVSSSEHGHVGAIRLARPADATSAPIEERTT
jgi:3-oxoacyl-[acyl-carrier-protein] synthase I